MIPSVLNPAQAPRSAKPELPEFIDAATFIATPIKAPDELVQGILHKGSKLVFGGSSKSYKTWSLLDLAISVATGTDWLGRLTTQGKVLFLNFEIQSYAWQKRIAAVAEAKGIELQPGQITLWKHKGALCDLISQPEAAHEVRVSGGQGYRCGAQRNEHTMLLMFAPWEARPPSSLATQ